MVYIDNKYIDGIENDILKNTDIKDINYVNEYDNYYIVMDNDNLYLFDNNYEEIYKVEIEKIYDNKNNYDIVYKDATIMYMDNYKDNDVIIFKYYDIYTYKLIDEVKVGDNYG